ncbi:MAG: tetratricopeptide repeat protein [Chitinophagaceae bacterium]|nr:tetratricopeptide repeat protein [Chitinophagaceae bacterium]
MRKYLYIFISCSFFLLTVVDIAGQAPPKPRDSTITGPQTFAMIMGISSYKYVRPLTYADKDAEMFRDYLKSPAGGKLSNDNIYCLLNEQALLANFYQKGFAWLKAKKLQKGDRLFIYLAGHGDAIDEDQFFYLAYDCNPAGDKNNYLVGGAIQLFNLKKKIATETAKGVEVYFIMDACRTNELPGGTEGQNFLNGAISENRAGEIIMLATGAGQESLEDASIGSGHGLFTYYLIDGLTGSADSMGTVDNQVTLAEIQKYVDKNVPNIAQQRFKRKQDPFFCCPEKIGSVVSIVDTAYLRKWINGKKLQSKGPGTSFAPRGRAITSESADTLLIEAYNLFNNALKESRLIGKASAEYYYSLMEVKYPGTSYTIDAQTTLAVEFINFAQSKINLYLDCKDASSIQRLRAQIDEDEKTDEITTSLNRMEKVAQQEFYEVGLMLEKAINFIMPDDPDFAKSLMGRMYFFKARGYFGRSRKLVDISKAFQYAYTAYADDKNAAYILNTLSSLHLDNNKIDSAIFYAKKAIIAAPRWRYPYVTLAFAYKTLNRPDSAIKYYERSIQVDPANADAYVDLGHYYYSLGKGDSAIAHYERALSIESNNVYASNNIGWINHDRKKYDNAIKYFKQSITADPKFINAYNGLSKTFFEMKLYDSARIYYSKAFANYQDKSIVNVYIGNFYKELKEYDSAKVYYRMAAEVDPNYEEAYNNLGQASFALKQMDSANYYYRRALVANPYSAFALINIGLVFKEMKIPDSTYFYFQQAVKVEPGNPSILNNLGVIYGQEKNYDSAKSYFRRALYLKPDYKPASNNLIKIFKEMNLLDSVTNFLKGTSLFDPNSTTFLNDMGMAFFDQKRYDSARWYIRKALQKDPQNSQFYSNLGLVFQGMKQYDSARVNMQKGLRIDPENTVIATNLASVFRQLKQYDSAAYYYKKQLYKKTDPGAQAYFAIGNFYDDMKVYDSAIVYFRMVIQQDAKFTPAYTQAGIAFMKIEMNDSAFVYLRQAMKIDPNSQSGSLNLGLVYHSMQQYDSAIVYIQNAIRLDPSKGKTYYQLACSYALANKPEQAILYLRQAYERGYKNVENLLADTDLAGLLNYKEFQALLDKYLPDWKNR